MVEFLFLLCMGAGKGEEDEAVRMRYCKGGLGWVGGKEEVLCLCAVGWLGR